MTPEANDDLDAWLDQFAPEMDSSNAAQKLTPDDDFLRTVRQGGTDPADSARPVTPQSTQPAHQEPEASWLTAASPSAFSAPAAPPPSSARVPEWTTETAADPLVPASLSSGRGLEWDQADDISEETWRTATGGHEVVGSRDIEHPDFADDEPRSATASLLLEWIPILIGAVVVAALVRTFVFQAFFIPSASMIPTLEIGDRVLVNKLSYDFNDVGWGDLVVFERPESAPASPEGIEDLIKRVMALPGDRIQFYNKDVYVNNVRVQETYLLQQGSTIGNQRQPIPNCIDATPDACTVPEGHVFMMGDNRAHSVDSREFGPVEIDSIVGRAFVRVWPIRDIGSF